MYYYILYMLCDPLVGIVLLTGLVEVVLHKIYFIILKRKLNNNYFFIYIEFQSMTFIFKNCISYHQTKTPIGFLCSRKLNIKSLI